MHKNNDSGFKNENNNDNTAMLVIYCYRLQLFFYSQKLILSTILFCDVSVCMKMFLFRRRKMNFTGVNAALNIESFPTAQACFTFILVQRGQLARDSSQGKWT